MSVDHQFTSINEKLQLLLKQHARGRKENEQLKRELEEQRKKEEQFKTRIDELHQQIAILKLAAGEMNEQDKKEFEKKINRYLKELDKCIAYLSQ